jgi:spore maturation protein B
LHIGSLVSALSAVAVPALLFAIPLYATARGVKVFEAFVDGAKGSFDTAVRLVPFLVGMMVAIAVFRESGAMDFVFKPAQALLALIGVPRDLVPLAAMRPVSGSGALGMLADLFHTRGPDSMVGRMGSTVVGSTETTLYVVAVYFGSVGVKRVRHSLAVGLTADLVGLLVAVAVCGRVFGH